MVVAAKAVRQKLICDEDDVVPVAGGYTSRPYWPGGDDGTIPATFIEFTETGAGKPTIKATSHLG